MDQAMEQAMAQAMEPQSTTGHEVPQLFKL
jgi:hypothetical protein